MWAMGCAVVLPPVAGDQDHLSVDIIQIIEDVLLKSESPLQLWSGARRSPCCRSGRRPASMPFPGQIVPVGGGGAEVQVSDGADHPAVHLLREGGVLVIGAQAGLHVAHGHLVVEGGQGAGEGGGGVTVDQDQVGLGPAPAPPPCPAGTWR